MALDFRYNGSSLSNFALPDWNCSFKFSVYSSQGRHAYRAGIAFVYAKKLGFYMWSAFCAGAVIMTIIKWSSMGTFLIVVSIVVGILMPSIAYVLMKPKIDEFK